MYLIVLETINQGTRMHRCRYGHHATKIKQDAREAMRVVFFCTCKTYLYMYAQDEISYEFIQILF